MWVARTAQSALYWASTAAGVGGALEAFPQATRIAAKRRAKTEARIAIEYFRAATDATSPVPRFSPEFVTPASVREAGDGAAFMTPALF